MGGSSKQTIGYWYKYLFHWGWTRGPVDAFLEWRVGDRTAWSGRVTESSQIYVNALNLFGGKKGEGGVQGYMDIMMGESTQAPNSYLAENLGPEQSGYRGKFTTVWRGGILGAMSPYPKVSSAKIERIRADWDIGECWYPEVAEITTSSAPGLYERFANGTLDAYTVHQGSGSGFSVVEDDYGPCIQVEPGATGHNVIWRELSVEAQMYRFRTKFKLVDLEPDDCGIVALYDAAGELLFNLIVARDQSVDALRRPAVGFIDVPFEEGHQLGATHVAPGSWYQFNATYNPHEGRFQCEILTLAGDVFGQADVVVGERGNAKYLGFGSDNNIGAGTCLFDDVEVIFGEATGAMNPAHMLYESITSRVENGGQGEPVGSISDESFRAAADKLFFENFGLCTTWDGNESAEDFQERICNLIGARLNQSRVDGKYYLDLIRDDYDFDSLPIIAESDVLEFEEEPSNLSEAINQVTVGWFDQNAKEPRVTAPMMSLGGIQSAGGVIAETYTHRELPNETLALRVGARYLALRSRPLSRFNLVTNRRPYKLRPGQFFRLQMPSEGIADMVCLAGDISYGQLGNGRMKIVALQDVFGLPSTVFVTPQESLDPGTDSTPVASPNQMAFEIPYVELASTLYTADLQALEPDVGYIGTVATRPPGMGINYAVYTAAGAEEYVEYGIGDWCPSALVVEGSVTRAETSFTLSAGSDLDLVTVGSWAIWGAEFCRVDAIDAVANTLSLGRACADTVPSLHAPGERIYFAGEWLASDRREYVDGETVNARLLTRTPGAMQLVGSASDNTIVMDQRQVRPYPPGQFTINGSSYPGSAFGLVTTAWVHRDRVLQADQLLDTSAAGVGPEAGTTYTVRWFADGILEHTDTGVAGTSQSYTPAGDCELRIELESSRDGLASWQFHEHTLAYTTTAPSFLLLESTDNLLLESGIDKFKLE